jgi:hypothetical protein
VNRKLADVVRQVISETYGVWRWTHREDRDGPEQDDRDAFDFWVATEGDVTAFRDAFYGVANAVLPQVRPGDGGEALALRTERRDALWDQVEPQLEAYVQECRFARYTGWSRASSGPIRRVR